MRFQNDRLKAELTGLSSHLEDLMARKRRGAARGNDDTRPDKELAGGQNRVKKLKQEIGQMKRQLEGTYNIEKVVQMEDELKHKTRVLQGLESEHQALLSVSKQQTEAVKALSKEDVYSTNIDTLANELLEAKKKLKKLQ